MSNEIELIGKELNPTLREKVEGQISGDLELTMFINEWLNNGLNATQAYFKFHPDISPTSARTLGSRMLAKVDISALLAGYQLGIDKFMEKLSEGLSACITNEEGQESPDYKVRFPHIQLLGRLHKLL